MSKFLDDYTVLMNVVNHDRDTRTLMIVETDTMKGRLVVKIKDRKAIVSKIDHTVTTQNNGSIYCAELIKKTFEYADVLEFVSSNTQEIYAILEAVDATRFDGTSPVGVNDFEVEARARITEVNQVLYSNDKVSNIAREVFGNYVKTLTFRRKK